MHIASGPTRRHGTARAPRRNRPRLEHRQRIRRARRLALGLGAALLVVAVAVAAFGPLALPAAGLVLTVPAVVILWRWCQPVAVTFGVLAGLAVAIAVGVILAGPSRPNPPPSPSPPAEPVPITVAVSPEGMAWV